ncbi:hypothetical protein N7517_005773 [Penicillium concentricum]|uniref:Uncharacterized protein n=1 Tax=Penicillium concentricum TaxID=293559 RepID=A0A9W9V9H9_9EURO|nr:uncharacterized protein N7517_005773 [Penicillium concentricum]KAJ5373767.1 hypothetical protein N7517_005773 [Penicillium concentricum]
MVPIQSSTTFESSNREAKVYSHKAVDCPLGTKVKSKFAHNPNLAEDEPFQPGNTGLSPEAPSSSQSTVDCPRAAKLMQSLPQHPPLKMRRAGLKLLKRPNESQTQSGTSGVNGNTDKLNLDAGVTAGNDMECSPGSELEAKFISDPTSRSVQCSRSALATQTPNKQIGISIDCPPGNELDTKLSSELAGLGLESAGPVHQTTNTAPTADPQASLECSPGSEIESHLLESSSQASAQSGAQTSIDCPPGNELEPKFIYNSASIEKMRSQPALRSSLGTSKMTKNIVDCTPGNELEAKFITEMASAEGPNENEDLSALSDTDIRSHCAPLKPKVQASPLDFGSSEGNISDFILQSQKLPTEKGEQPAASISPKFHILAFDTSTSQVIAAQADSFFGVDEEDNRPSKILSQLHNPAKFLPYFEKMQEGGYEIATGGGNILVFRKSQPTPCHTLSNTATDQQPVVHTKIARHLRHDSTDPAAKYAGAPWQSTTEPRSKTGSFSSEPESTTKSKSSFRKTGRRMLVAGTATAATCYAIGVMIEFFRTGGKDGRGIDGFTVFESDRRRRE